MKHNSIFDRCFIFSASLFVSVPSFIMTIALMLIFGVWLKLLPVAYLDGFDSYIMPVFGMAIYPMCSLARLTRTTMLDVIGQITSRPARAKGLPRRRSCSSTRCATRASPSSRRSAR